MKKTSLIILSSLILFAGGLASKESEPCQCGSGFVDYCKISGGAPEGTHFIGFCSSEGKRLYGKSFYDSGTTFEGAYLDGLDKLGVITWEDGDKFEGEIRISKDDYEISSEIDSDKALAIGQYVFGTITERGFFDLGGFNLFGFGTVFNADTDANWSYRAATYKNGKRIEDKEFLITKKFNEDSSFALWGGGINGPIVYSNSSGKKEILVYDENGEIIEEIEGWDEASENEVRRISEVIEEKKYNLDMNFELLDDRLKQLRNFNPRENGPRKNTVIKPLASELVRSVQELLSILGYETGKIDGILGRITIAAIKAFQKEKEVEITGRPSEDLLMQLQAEVRNLNNQNATSEEAINPVLPIISTGTGFYVNNNTIISNYHVIDTCNYISIGKEERLVVNAIDQVNDITVLESKRKSDAFLRLSSNPKLGNNIFAAGYPYNDILKNFNFTSGNVSSLMGSGSNISEFQFTAPIQPGNSGGPILNNKGGVVGIAVSGLGAKFAELADTLPQNINFGIKVGVLKDILTEQGIKYSEGNEFWFDSSEEKIADLSRKSSVLINCHAKPNK